MERNEVANGPQDTQQRTKWTEPELERREILPRVTNGFAGSFNP